MFWRYIVKPLLIMYLVSLIGWVVFRHFRIERRLLSDKREDTALGRQYAYWLEPELYKQCDMEKLEREFTEMRPEGVTLEEFKVTTGDGYIVTIHHFSYNKNKGKTLKRPVLYIGGLADSDESLFFQGENSSGFYFLKNGFDLWALNKRGCKYAMEAHINPDIKHKDYWNFSFQEIALYDIPAAFKFVLDYTKTEKLNVMTQSMGGLEYVLAASDETIGDWIQDHTYKVVSLAPNIFMHVNKYIQMHIGKNFVGWFFKPFMDFIGKFKLEPFCIDMTWISLPLIRHWNLNDKYLRHLLPGFNMRHGVDDIDAFEIHGNHYMSGTSLRNFWHAMQMMKQSEDDLKLYKYDFGTAENMKRYNQATPPSYAVEKIKADITIIAGTIDHYSPLEGLIEFNKITGDNVKLIVEEDWGHVTFIIPLHYEKLFKVYDEVFNYQIPDSSIEEDLVLD